MTTTSGEVYYGDGNAYLNGENSTGLIPRNHLYRLTTLNQLFRLDTGSGADNPIDAVGLQADGTLYFGGRVSGYFRTIREKDVETLYAGGQIALLDGPLSAGLVRIELTPTSRDPEAERRPLPFRLHPNPVTEGVLQLRLESPLSSDASYQLLSADGRPTLITGIIPAGASAVELSLAHLPKGVFFLVMTSEGKQRTVRVVKQ